MTDVRGMNDVLDAPFTESERAEITRLLDEFLATGSTRNLVPMSEVQNLALDLRLILNPVPKDVLPSLS